MSIVTLRAERLLPSAWSPGRLLSRPALTGSPTPVWVGLSLLSCAGPPVDPALHQSPGCLLSCPSLTGSLTLVQVGLRACCPLLGPYGAPGGLAPKCRPLRTVTQLPLGLIAPPPAQWAELDTSWQQGSLVWL